MPDEKPLHVVADLLAAERARKANEPPPDPDLKKVGHFVHSALGLSNKELLLLRRHVRKHVGELPPEESLPPLQELPTAPLPPTAASLYASSTRSI